MNLNLKLIIIINVCLLIALYIETLFHLKIIARNYNFILFIKTSFIILSSEHQILYHFLEFLCSIAVVVVIAGISSWHLVIRAILIDLGVWVGVVVAVVVFSRCLTCAALLFLRSFNGLSRCCITCTCIIQCCVLKDWYLMLLLSIFLRRCL